MVLADVMMFSDGRGAMLAPVAGEGKPSAAKDCRLLGNGPDTRLPANVEPVTVRFHSQ
jgi:hypothetical protein